ncbi:MAG: holo-ACP synthase [Candidatus Magnetobacterium sp. LHC-1]|uniref:Holo-[acyl-carrier-protein] synthase n=1 Tax=Candidatus Magnetobacterium casense TaxID=1455061 RepID=A0ABS6S074_9BACT|nr:holo-ACP synthase [Candidatus Magnetobacterium casensis]MBF0608467.1 holo-ACP synthase [Nitrospirota bacterium]MBV6342216.1 holo-ACP synthase [Candidatus Magnetobacterium casensis]
MRLFQGLDIVYIPKFKDVADRNTRLVTDIFTEKERITCMQLARPYVSLAGRFAAKEAMLKAIGIGFIATGVFQNIEVSNQPSGKPTLTLRGWIKALMKRRNITEVTVSISHSADYAAATVILLSTDNPLE